MPRVRTDHAAVVGQLASREAAISSQVKIRDYKTARCVGSSNLNRSLDGDAHLQVAGSRAIAVRKAI